MKITITGAVPDGAVIPIRTTEDTVTYIARDYLTVDDLKLFDEEGQEVFTDRSNWTNFELKTNPVDGSLTAEITMRFNVNAAEISPVPLIIRNGAVVPGLIP